MGVVHHQKVHILTNSNSEFSYKKKMLNKQSFYLMNNTEISIKNWYRWKTTAAYLICNHVDFFFYFTGC